MNRFRSSAGRLAMLSLAICALATAVPAAAQKDERRPVTMQATPPHVTAFAVDSVQTASPIMHAMQYVDSMPASTYYSALIALAVSVILVSRVTERRGRRMRNGLISDDDDEDDDDARWRNRPGFMAMSASPGGGY